MSDEFLYLRDYNPASSVARLHKSGRFGSSRDVSILLFEDDTSEYTKGLVIGAVLVVLVFVMWAINLGVSKAMGPKRVGYFWSGHPYRSKGNHSKYGRITFATAIFIMYMTNIILVRRGIGSLDDTVDTLITVKDDVDTMAIDLLTILERVKDSTSAALPLRDRIVEFLQEEACPNAAFSNNVEGATVLEILQLSEETVAEMESIRSSVFEDLDDAIKAAEELEEAPEPIEDVEETADNTRSRVNLFVGFMYLTTTLLLLALINGWKEFYYHRRLYLAIDYVLLPLFCILLIGAVAGAAIGMAAARVNSDFCSGGDSNTPEATIERILTLSDDISDLTYDAGIYFSSQCQVAESPFTFLEDLNLDLRNVRASVVEIRRSLRDLSDTLPVGCILGADGAEERAAFLLTRIDELVAGTGNTLSILACEFVVPIYTSLVYDAGCTYAIRFEFSVFLSCFFMALAGMTILTFRSAYYPIDAYREDQELLQKERELKALEEEENDWIVVNPSDVSEGPDDEMGDDEENGEDNGTNDEENGEDDGTDEDENTDNDEDLGEEEDDDEDEQEVDYEDASEEEDEGDHDGDDEHEEDDHDDDFEEEEEGEDDDDHDEEDDDSNVHVEEEDDDDDEGDDDHDEEDDDSNVYVEDDEETDGDDHWTDEDAEESTVEESDRVDPRTDIPIQSEDEEMYSDIGSDEETQ